MIYQWCSRSFEMNYVGGLSRFLCSDIKDVNCDNEKARRELADLIRDACINVSASKSFAFANLSWITSCVFCRLGFSIVGVVLIARTKTTSTRGLWISMTVTSHGIPEEIIDNTIAVAREYFALPEETKKEVSLQDLCLLLGYIYWIQRRLFSSLTFINRPVTRAIPLFWAKIPILKDLEIYMRALTWDGNPQSTVPLPRRWPLEMTAQWQERTYGPRTCQASKKQYWITSKLLFTITTHDSDHWCPVTERSVSESYCSLSSLWPSIFRRTSLMTRWSLIFRFPGRHWSLNQDDKPCRNYETTTLPTTGPDDLRKWPPDWHRGPYWVRQ